jgi:hypothetical protein
MDSPLARVILATLAGYLIILAFLSVYDWLVEEYPQRPTQQKNSERIQHQAHHHEAVDALLMFSRLPQTEKTAIKENLRNGLISIDQWHKNISQSNYQIVCMGEFHEEATRNFLAKEIFSRFKADALLLEATPKELKRIISRMEAGREYFPLLGSDILNLLSTVKDMNPGITIHGIEETAKQVKKRHGHSNSRDQNIAQNFWATFQPGLRHIILFGALHCTNESNWLFNNIYCQASPKLKNRMLSMHVLGEHQNGSLEAFVFFLDEIALKKRHFVIPDTRLLHPRIYEFFPLLNQQTLMKYRTLIVFR